MTLSDVLILGLVQGLTEFLPVSSSGHLIVARMLFGIPDVSGTAFDAFLHLGTLLALLVYYWKVWREMNRELLGILVVATVPGAIAGYFLQDVVDSYLRAPVALAGGFVVTAVVLVLAEIIAKRANTREVTMRDAWWIGIAQVAALIPSVSRSGVTIAAGQGLGLSRKEATTFSFLMAAPIIAGAGLASVSTLVTGHMFSSAQFLVGLFASFLAGLAGIFLLMRMSEKIGFWPFAVYLVVLSGVLMYVAS